jgi:hypothetical protein
MANALRGEVEVVVDGRPRILRLTLGALAGLEAALGCGGLVALAERFDGDGLGARDVIATLTAGFRGAGETVSAEEVAEMAFEGGAAGAAAAAARLVRAAFTGSAA